MVIQFSRQNESRLRQVRTFKGAQGQYLNGIDYLEIGSDRTILVLHLIRDLPPTRSLNQENLLLEGGNIPVEIESVSSFANLVTIKVKAVGDRSTYRLRLVESLVRRGFSNLNELPPPQGFDPQLSEIDFSWQEKVSESDYQPVEPPSEKPELPPNIDYLAKDYASFRQLMLDRLALTVPKWRERNPSDLGIMLVELVAYAADRLSYYQDAVATEAYLGTARKRISVRRHSRLLDYFMHDGCNARVWVTVEVKKEVKLPGPDPENHHRGTQLLTRVPTLTPGVIHSNQLIDALNLGTEVFETMHELTLHPACNEIQFYTWGNEQCELPKGTTKATLKDSGGKLQQCLKPGAILILLEQLNPETGQSDNIDLTHRHVVRLTKVTPDEDPLFVEDSPEGKNKGRPQRVLKIEWSQEDALPFSLTVANQLYLDLSVAKGNVVLADYGRTVPNRPLKQPPQDISEYREDLINRDEKILDPKKLNLIPDSDRYKKHNLIPDRDRYRPRLKRGVLTQQGYVLDRHQKWVRFDPEASAKEAFDWEMRDTKPAMFLREYDRGQKFDWQFRRDLLNSDRFARDFIVETEDDGSAYLRFGDNVLGKKPVKENYFEVTYRIGNGIAGNVGAESIAYLVTDNEKLKNAIEKVSNPFPAQGGTEPESIEQVRLYAPQAFRELQRAVTTKDYAQIAERHPEVQRAGAVRRWTGSWYTIFIYIYRKQGLPIDKTFKDKILKFLERFRLAGHDIAIEALKVVPLDLALTVKVNRKYFRSTVKRALLEAFSNRVLPNGQLGIFHPDRLTIGEPVYLSQLLEMAVKIEGVLAVEFTRFRRLDQPKRDDYLARGQIPINPLEIALLENDPAKPEQGRIEFNMEGGL